MAVPFSEGSRRYNVAPTQEILAVVRGRDGAPQARLLQWGLVPPWADPGKGPRRMINVRSERADANAACRRLLASADTRALLLADGFYEWLAPEDRRQPRVPFRFTLADGEPFAFAGLWTVATLEGERVESAAILTTAANAVVGAVHDRMPVILADADAEQAWLSPQLDAPAAKALCVALPTGRVQATAANPLVNSATAEEGPHLLVAAG